MPTNGKNRWGLEHETKMRKSVKEADKCDECNALSLTEKQISKLLTILNKENH